jgi:SAM-dependent methyltransferase
LLAAGDNANMAIPFAAHVQQVTQVCLSAGQAGEVEQAAAKVHKSKIVCDNHAPDNLPYRDKSFDLVVCHQFAHILSEPEAWLLEAARVLKPQGLIAISSYLVPGTRLRGKKARQLRQAADYLNAFWLLRDPSHRRFFSQSAWEDLLQGAGFYIQHLQTADQLFDFSTWVSEDSLTGKDRLRLKAMLVQAPEKAREFLTPQFSGDRIRFRLPEITILAKSKANSD